LFTFSILQQKLPHLTVLTHVYKKFQKLFSANIYLLFLSFFWPALLPHNQDLKINFCKKRLGFFLISNLNYTPKPFLIPRQNPATKLAVINNLICLAAFRGRLRKFLIP